MRISRNPIIRALQVLATWVLNVIFPMLSISRTTYAISVVRTTFACERPTLMHALTGYLALEIFFRKMRLCCNMLVTSTSSLSVTRAAAES